MKQPDANRTLDPQTGRKSNRFVQSEVIGMPRSTTSRTQPGRKYPSPLPLLSRKTKRRGMESVCREC